VGQEGTDRERERLSHSERRTHARTQAAGTPLAEALKDGFESSLDVSKAALATAPSTSTGAGTTGPLKRERHGRTQTRQPPPRQPAWGVPATTHRCRCRWTGSTQQTKFCEISCHLDRHLYLRHQAQRRARAQWVVPNDARQHNPLGHAQRHRQPACRTPGKPHGRAPDWSPGDGRGGARWVEAAADLRWVLG
jgi:hypothetical protein